MPSRSFDVYNDSIIFSFETLPILVIRHLPIIIPSRLLIPDPEQPPSPQKRQIRGGSRQCPAVIRLRPGEPKKNLVLTPTPDETQAWFCHLRLLIHRRYQDHLDGLLRCPLGNREERVGHEFHHPKRGQSYGSRDEVQGTQSDDQADLGDQDGRWQERVEIDETSQGQLPEGEAGYYEPDRRSGQTGQNRGRQAEESLRMTRGRDVNCINRMTSRTIRCHTTQSFHPQPSSARVRAGDMGRDLDILDPDLPL
jgi:hypothetical protein